MYENIIVPTIVSIAVAAIGWLSGSSIERKKHNNNIDFLFLTKKLDAYSKFLSETRETSVYTGKIISANKCLRNKEQFKEYSIQLHSHNCQLWTDSSNPLILSDRDVQECMIRINESIASIEIGLMDCANGKREGLIKCQDAQIKMMDSIRKCESSISKKFDSHFSNIDEQDV